MSEATLENPPPAPTTAEPNSMAGKELPAYARNLLKVRVPVTVRLATKKEKVADIMQLGPGAIIKLDKPCDTLLDLFVGDRCVAQGDAVKVEDKFGLRIARIVLPEERFGPLRGGHSVKPQEEQLKPQDEASP